jgi:lipopolysaccharide transport system permease protein
LLRRDPTEPQQRTTQTVIEPVRGWQAVDLHELWHYRELLYFLTWRDIKVRYKQTALGATWAILQPVLTMAVFSIIFGRLIGVPSNGVPYPVFCYAALVPWTFASGAVSRAAMSLVTSANVISKVYFPRLLIPISATLAMAVDSGVAFVLLLGILLLYGIAPGPAIVLLPTAAGFALLTALGIGVWLSALNVRYRDVSHVVPFLVQLWLFVTPVAYPSSIIPQPWQALYGLNPMVGVVEVFRWTLLGTEAPSNGLLVLSSASALAILVSGLAYFRHVEGEFADVV